MRARAVALAFALLALSGCGYVGPVLPPSPELPQAVTDLEVIERGDQLLVSFTTPVRTTDNLSIKQFSELELRIGVSPRPFDFDQWAASATAYELPLPSPGESETSIGERVSKAIAATDFADKRVAVAVRTAVKKNNHFSAWSNRVVLNVVAPIPPPTVKIEPSAKGAVLTAGGENEGTEFRIYRKTAGSKEGPLQVGTSASPVFTDAGAQYDLPYEYTAIAVKQASESLPSKPVPFTLRDTFGPSTPAGVAALGAPNSIEVSWQRSPESDLKGYYIFRSTNGGPFEKLGDLLTVPAYSDRSAQHGKAYRYEISAVDQKNNSSDRSAPAEVNY